MSRVEVYGVLYGLGALCMLSFVVGCDVSPRPHEDVGDEATQRTHKRGTYHAEPPSYDPEGRRPRPGDDISLDDSADAPEVECRQIGTVGEQAVCGPRDVEDIERFEGKDADDFREVPIEEDGRDLDGPGWIGSGPCGDCLEAFARFRDSSIDRMRRATAVARAQLDDSGRSRSRVSAVRCRSGVGCVADIEVARDDSRTSIDQAKALASAAWTLEVVGEVDGTTQSHVLTPDVVFVWSGRRQQSETEETTREEVASWRTQTPQLSGQEEEKR